MNRINPLHIIILLIVIIIFLFFQLSKIQDDLHEQRRVYKKSETIAKELVAYKKFYGDERRIKNSLRKILSQSSLRAAKLKRVTKSRAVLITSNSIELYALNSLMSKIFNGAYPVKILEIKRVDDTHAKLKLEIVW